MSGEEEKQFEDLKDVEAALGSLVPRGDRISRDRLMFLAGQASVGGGTDAMATPGTDRRLVAPCTPRRDMPTTSVGMAPAPTTSVRVAPARGTRWAWPSAFAAMSAVAAALLAMLVVRPAPQVVERIVETPVPGVRSPERTGLPDEREHFVRSTEYAVLSTPPRLAPAGDAYHELLERVLARGLDAWKPPAGGGVTVTAATPATYWELMETLLDHSQGEGGARPSSTL